MIKTRIFSTGIFLLVSTLACLSLPDNPTCIDNWNPFRSFPPPFGKEYNSVRQQIGLPIIPADWEAGYYAGEADYGWSNPKTSESRDQRIPFHWVKSLHCENGQLISESDIYMGAKDVKFDDTPARERITIIYYYPTDTTDARWEVFGSVEGIILADKEGAVRILAEWGIEYP